MNSESVFTDFLVQFQKKYGKNLSWQTLTQITKSKNKKNGAIMPPYNPYWGKKGELEFITDENIIKGILLGHYDGFEYGRTHYRMNKMFNSKAYLDTFSFWLTKKGKLQLQTLDPDNCVSAYNGGWQPRLIVGDIDDITVASIQSAYRHRQDELELFDDCLDLFWGYKDKFGYLCNEFGRFVCVIAFTPHYFDLLYQPVYYWSVYDSLLYRENKKVSWGYAKSIQSAKNTISMYLKDMLLFRHSFSVSL